MVSAPKGAVGWWYIQEEKESADKPGSVVDSHSSGTGIAPCLEQPTREPCGPHVRVAPPAPLFGLAPGGVFRAADGYPPRGALLPHLFTLAGACALGRSVLCGTFRGLTPPRRYLALCPMEPGLSSMLAHCDCLADSGTYHNRPATSSPRAREPADRGGSC